MANTIKSRSLIFVFFFFSFGACQAQKIDLIKSGKTSYIIILPQNSTKAEQNAASLLQHFVSRISKVDIGITYEKNKPESANYRSFISIGNTLKAKKTFSLNNVRLSEDAVNIKFDEGNIFLFGSGDRGTLYSTVEFLEQYLGCRWWSSVDNEIPEKTEVVIDPVDYTFSPPFSYRNHLSFHSTVDAFYSTVLRENGDFQRLNESWGAKHEIVGWAHTFSQILPPDKYFKRHPEWFIDPATSKPFKNSGKVPGVNETQLCLSNQEMRKEFINNVRLLIQKTKNPEIISISQNDVGISCSSVECANLLKEEGSPSALLIQFVNEVASAFKDEYPSLKFETLAYDYTEVPPKTIKPAENVIVRVAPILINHAKSLLNPSNNFSRKNIENWSKISKHNFYWGYSANFSYPLLPHPSLSNLRDDLRFLKNLGYEGVFIQSIATPYYTSEELGYFKELHTWVIGKLLWNPDYEYNYLLDVFFNGYYGAAGKPLRKYFDLVTRSFDGYKGKLSVFNANLDIINSEILNEGTKLFEQAISAVSDNEILLRRVKKEQISFEFIKIFSHIKSPALDNSRSSSDFHARYNSLVDRFLATLNDLNTMSSDRLKQKIDVNGPMIKLNDLKPSLKSIRTSDRESNSDYFVVQQDLFTYYLPAVRTKKIIDGAASDKLAGYIDASKSDWAIQYKLENISDSQTNEKWEVSTSIKGHGNIPEPKEGRVTIGLYDPILKRNISIVEIDLSELANEKYQTYSLRNVTLKNGNIVFFSVHKDKSNIEGISIDKIEFKKEK
ncbi:DUF4838 domain-containing protein [Parapedobacter sp. GCM10030251]|uniref:DUF4838 domain-containing protein n=1 Tax=Parapedobacter sp. GCM10030251 TaxID=3273419 RepID=UPI00361A265F